ARRGRAPTTSHRSCTRSRAAARRRPQPASAIARAAHGDPCAEVEQRTCQFVCEREIGVALARTRKCMEMRRNPRSRRFAITAVALLAGCAKEGGAAEQPRLEGPAAVQFVQRARDYVRQRDSATATVPKLVETPSPVEISAREHALAEAIRAARASAKQGD